MSTNKTFANYELANLHRSLMGFKSTVEDKPNVKSGRQREAVAAGRQRAAERINDAMMAPLNSPLHQVREVTPPLIDHTQVRAILALRSVLKEFMVDRTEARRLAVDNQLKEFECELCPRSDLDSDEEEDTDEAELEEHLEEDSEDGSEADSAEQGEGCGESEANDIGAADETRSKAPKTREEWNASLRNKGKEHDTPESSCYDHVDRTQARPITDSQVVEMGGMSDAEEIAKKFREAMLNSWRRSSEVVDSGQTMGLDKDDEEDDED